MNFTTFRKLVKRAIETDNMEYLENILSDIQCQSYDNGYMSAINKFTHGIECTDEEGNTLGTVKYHFEKGDSSVGIADYDCMILTETPIKD